MAKKRAPATERDEGSEQLRQMLQLLAAQLQAAVTDHDQTMAELTAAHHAIATTLEPVMARETNNATLTRRLHKEMNRMVVAFQGHDAFNQRLEHIRVNLEELGKHLSSKELDDSWRELTELLSTRYTTAQERRVHERIRGGDRESHKGTPDAEEGSIELF